MELNAFTFGLVLVGLPGILCYLVLSKLIGKCGRTALEVLLYLVIFSLLAYGLYGGLLRLLGQHLEFGDSVAVGQASGSMLVVPPIHILGAALTGIILAYVLSYGYRFNVLNRIGQKIGATRRAGDEDVWHYFHNASDESWSSDWYVIRDHKTNLQYFAAIDQWSDTGKERELLLSAVSVFSNADGTPLYECKHLYVCRDRDDLTIEIHQAGGNDGA